MNASPWKLGTPVTSDIFLSTHERGPVPSFFAPMKVPLLVRMSFVPSFVSPFLSASPEGPIRRSDISMISSQMEAFANPG